MGRAAGVSPACESYWAGKVRKKRILSPGMQVGKGIGIRTSELSCPSLGQGELQDEGSSSESPRVVVAQSHPLSSIFLLQHVQLLPEQLPCLQLEAETIKELCATSYLWRNLSQCLHHYCKKSQHQDFPTTVKDSSQLWGAPGLKHCFFAREGFCLYCWK